MNMSGERWVWFSRNAAEANHEWTPMDTNLNGSERAGFGFQDGLQKHAWGSRAARALRGFTTTPIRVPSCPFVVQLLDSAYIPAPWDSDQRTAKRTSSMADFNFS